MVAPRYPMKMTDIVVGIAFLEKLAQILNLFLACAPARSFAKAPIKMTVKIFFFIPIAFAQKCPRTNLQ